IFKEGGDLNSEELRTAFDEISQKLPGFYIGRYDIRYRSDDELRAGKEFQIIELNGAASEATNIYDEGNSLWSAYNTLYRQWKRDRTRISAGALRRGVDRLQWSGQFARAFELEWERVPQLRRETQDARSGDSRANRPNRFVRNRLSFSSNEPGWPISFPFGWGF